KKHQRRLRRHPRVSATNQTLSACRVAESQSGIHKGWIPAYDPAYRQAGARMTEDEGSMYYELTEEQQTIVETARDIAQKKIKKVREHYDKTEEYPWEIVEELRKADLFGVYIPQEYGGLGGGAMELVLLVEELSKACGGIALCVGATAVGACPTLLYGNAEQQKK